MFSEAGASRSRSFKCGAGAEKKYGAGAEEKWFGSATLLRTEEYKNQSANNLFFKPTPANTF